METLLARQYLALRLRDLGIPVYRHGTAPMSATPLPLCVYSIEPQTDVRHKMGLTWSPVQSVVRVINEGNVRDIEAYVAEVDRLLAMAPEMELESGSVKGVRRLRGFSLPPWYREGSNKPMYEEGGVYELKVCAKASA